MLMMMTMMMMMIAFPLGLAHEVHELRCLPFVILDRRALLQVRNNDGARDGVAINDGDDADDDIDDGVEDENGDWIVTRTLTER